MHIKLDADILNQSNQCRRDFSCLTGDKNCLCEVDRLIDHGLLFIKPAVNNICNHKMSFGYSAYYCTCPARVEIYKLYNI
jgi:hypothetical protein